MRLLVIVAVALLLAGGAAFIGLHGLSIQLEQRLVADLEVEAREAPDRPFVAVPELRELVQTQRASVDGAAALPLAEGLARCDRAAVVAGDTARGGDLVYDMVAVAILERMVIGCTPVLARATVEAPDAARASRARLRALVTSYPRFAVVLRRELAVMRLRAFGSALSTARRARLPAGAPALIEDGASLAGQVWPMGIYVWRGVLRQHDAILAAYQAPAAERDRLLAAVEAPRLDMTPDFRRFSDKHDAALARVVALAAEPR